MIHELPGSLPAAVPMPLPRRVLLTTPDHFQVQYVINPHMEGHLGSVDPDRAAAQWSALRDRYSALGMDVHTLAGQPGLPDMVFCANQTLPFLDTDGRPGIVASRMASPHRAPEVPHFEAFFADRGYVVVPVEAGAGGSFEGMGDALWQPGIRRLWGGYGFRTDRAVYDRIQERLDADICLVALDNPDFYHLDTCLSILDGDTALYFPGAFRPEGVELLRQGFARLIEAPEDEARRLFACNAHCPDGRHVLIQRGCRITTARLLEAGYTVIELDTDEFLKSGGSVFCMKVVFW